MAGASELRSLVHEHCLFFDRLVELVPAKFYIAHEDQENTWHYGMSKAARAAAKRATKEHLKKARRDRLDPDKFTSTLKLVQQQDSAGAEDSEDKEEAEHAANTRFKGEVTRAGTYEELRERLRKRIDMLRAKRNADAAAAAAKNARNWQNEKKKDSQKQKRKKTSVASSAEGNNGEMPAIKRQKGSTDNGDGAAKKEEPAEVTAKFEFGRVKMGFNSDNVNGRHKRRKESKEQLLAKATKMQSEIQDPEKGQEVALKHSWSAAVSRAAGEKVFDDPKLLKRSMKKEKQQQQKSSRKWAERKESVKKTAEMKQQNRSEHIQQRKEQKKERQIAKREKKLLRPGFEGRKAGFINT